MTVAGTLYFNWHDFIQPKSIDWFGHFQYEVKFFYEEKNRKVPMTINSRNLDMGGFVESIVQSSLDNSKDDSCRMLFLDNSRMIPNTIPNII